MSYINVETKLDPKKSTNKEYFEKKLNSFIKQVKKSEIMEELRLKRCFYKPSVLRKLKKQNAPHKWKFYN